MTELSVIRPAVAVIGKLNRSLTYTIKNGQIMLAPMLLISIPQNISQNCRG